jgi:phosphoesterase RecJ-like protein
MKAPPKLRKIIAENKKFLIVSHMNPEADAIGSSIGLALGLKKLGKYAYVLNRDPLPDILKFLPRADMVKGKIPSREFDVLCVVDCNSLERTGLKDLKAKNTVIIDHHIPSPQVTRHTFHSSQLVSFIDENASATGELVYKVLHSLKVQIDREIATNLYTSIYSDTGGFRYSNTGPESLIIASRLIEAGAKPWEVTKEIYESMPFNRLHLLALMLSTLKKNGPIASVVIQKSMYKKTKTSVQDTEDFVDFPRKVKDVEVAVLFREDRHNLFKISLRSKGTVNVEKIARYFGGGGHHNAAGCRMEGSLTEVKRKMFNALNKAIR